MNNQISIQALKYPSHLHYEWKTTRLEQTDSHIFVLAEYGRQLHHYTKQSVFTMKSWTIEFFPFDAWYTVSADVADGQIQQYYCNINQPAVMKGNTVSFVDLDLDYVYRNGKWMVVDEDEFESNAIKFAYPVTLIDRAREELERLKEAIREKRFPFDGSMERWMDRIPGG